LIETINLIEADLPHRLLPIAQARAQLAFSSPIDPESLAVTRYNFQGVATVPKAPELPDRDQRG
jgi:hypothetical protein